MKTVAVLGASQDHGKFGNKAVRAFRDQGYKVYPVNPAGQDIEGLKTYASLSDIPEAKLDCVTVYLHKHVALTVLDEVAKKGTGELWLNPGADSTEVVDKARSLGLNVIVACSLVGIGVSPSAY